MSRDLREAILGHDTGVAGRYHVGKRWGEELLAEARREYAGAAEFLETNGSTKVDVKRELVASLVRAVEEATGNKTGPGGTMTPEDLISALKRSLDGSSRGASVTAPASNAGGPSTVPASSPRPTQRLVAPGELDGLLSNGWRYVATVGERIVVEPSH